MDYRNPQTTLDVLEKLEEHGLTQQQFLAMHHTDKTASIGGHRTYSTRILNGKTKKFDPGRNAETAERLAVCLAQLEDGEPWDIAIARALVAMPFSGVRSFLPTADEDQLQSAIAEISSHEPPPEPPAGQPKPRAIVIASTTRFERDPNVAAWVLRRAGGRCEHCLSSAPFNRADGTPFLEVHHVVRLADRGSDTTTNTTALCPNCHRLLHHSHDAGQAADRIYSNVAELRRESGGTTA
jgi:5-methylcytosine-specific restriction endonuclease McrA